MPSRGRVSRRAEALEELIGSRSDEKNAAGRPCGRKDEGWGDFPAALDVLAGDFASLAVALETGGSRFPAVAESPDGTRTVGFGTVAAGFVGPVHAPRYGRPMSTLHDFKIRSIDGSERPLSDLRGKAVLVVNVASQCGLTPQYAGLEELQKSYEGRGFTVLGFPCNQFAGQEPGSESEIQKFCSMTYGVTFPLAAKIDVNGDGRDPLYAWLTTQDTAPDGAGDIKWNFAKFLVGKDGRVLRRYSPMVTPEDADLRSDIEAALA
jgi:glutathione peroxidase